MKYKEKNDLCAVCVPANWLGTYLLKFVHRAMSASESTRARTRTSMCWSQRKVADGSRILSPIVRGYSRHKPERVSGHLPTRSEDHSQCRMSISDNSAALKEIIVKDHRYTVQKNSFLANILLGVADNVRVCMSSKTGRAQLFEELRQWPTTVLALSFPCLHICFFTNIQQMHSRASPRLHLRDTTQRIEMDRQYAHSERYHATAIPCLFCQGFFLFSDDCLNTYFAWGVVCICAGDHQRAERR
jgi:hypothetical protein